MRRIASSQYTQRYSSDAEPTLIQRHIWFTSRWGDVQADLDAIALEGGGLQDGVVMTYLERPLLIDGLKFDMRIYVLVTCCAPLQAYIFSEGTPPRSACLALSAL